MAELFAYERRSWLRRFISKSLSGRKGLGLRVLLGEAATARGLIIFLVIGLPTQNRIMDMWLEGPTVAVEWLVGSEGASGLR